uniref:hypothetical protein n=1 Tax=Campylaephora boydenii TaxID=202204 RepID=UPI0025520720|nr:hypothetical protein QQR83_pgp062 [Campylaephora boydenii]WGT74181.1 hypothetical protein [Campylaephora boydenii]
MIFSIHKIYTYKFTNFSLNLVSLLLGFYLSTILSTIPAQTGDWNIINASIIVTINEIFSKFFYSYYKKHKPIFMDISNSIKIGIIYGLFVDAFKLGS